MKKVFMNLILVLQFLVFVLGSYAVVYAQEGSSNEFVLDEITVTAEKRVENLQKTSISMEVVQGDNIREAGETAIKDILKNIPNVSTGSLGSSGQTINIRGIGNDLPTGVGDSSVATNFDGVFQARPETTAFGFYDIERVEVLRGPQGTLYGRNATAGVLNVISVKPSLDKLDGYVSLEIAEYNKRSIEAAVNVPLTDTLAGRVSILSSRTDNFLQDDHGYRDSKTGLAYRLQLRYTPTNDVSLGLLYSEIYTKGELLTGVTKDNWNAGIYDVYTNNDNVYPYSRTNKNYFYDSKIQADIEFPFAFGIVTFLPSHEELRSRTNYYGFFHGSGEARFIEDARPWNNRLNTAELRYANKSDAKIKWTMGLYWNDMEEPQVPNSITGNHPELPDNKKYAGTKAIFGQTTYPFTDTFRLILGARYSADEKGYYNSSFAITDPSQPIVDESQVPPIRKTFKFNYFDWKVGVEKDVNKQIMLYFTAATGHKPGGFNENNGWPFKEESSVSGELGIKSRFMENHLQVNGDVFYFKYDNYQVVDFTNVFHPATGLTNLDAIFFNAPEATSTGAELNTTALIGDATVFTLNVGYLDNKYTDTFIVHPDNPFDAVDQDGKPMPHSPKFSLYASIDHTFVFGNGNTLKPSVSFRWVDEQYSGIMVKPTLLTPSYSVLYASLRYTPNKDWYLNIYANNVLDNHYYNEVFAAGPQLRVYPGDPLQIGAVFGRKF